MAWLFLPENVLPQWQQKIALRAENTPRPYHYNWGRRFFCAFAQFFAGIGPAHFPAAFGMLLSQHPMEGAPFMGTALAAHKQPHWARRLLPFSPSLFHKFSNSLILDNRTGSGWSFLALPFFYSKDWSLFLLMLFRPSKMVAEIYWRSDERARSRRWLTI